MTSSAQWLEPGSILVERSPEATLRLSFAPATFEDAKTTLRLEEAWEWMAAAPVWKGAVGSRARLLQVSTSTAFPSGSPDEPGPWRLRQDFLSLYGPSPVPMPSSLESSALWMALRLSPRYMGDGVRGAAHELFSSPVFLSSVSLSVLLYFSAWLLPEPVFSKAFVVALTLRLTLAVGALELGRVARTCVRLYQETEAARTLEELDAAARRFGEAMGGTGLRVLMLVASMGVGKGLPRIPQGGLGNLWRNPRFAMPGGMSLEGATAVKMVADGTVLVTGVAAATAVAFVGGACADGVTSKPTHQWHHIATNKNGVSTRTGGPWTPLFERLFAKAGMSLETAENLVYLQAHKGPHPEAYHTEVYQRIEAEMSDCSTPVQCKNSLNRALKKLAGEVCTPGSGLHRLLTNP